MKSVIMGCLSLGAIALMGCAGSQNAVDNSLGRAEATMTLAKESKVSEAATAGAIAKIDSAKALKEDDASQATLLADQGELELRLAIATSERDQVKQDDEKLEKELRADVERKLLYQSILDNEKKEGAK